MKKHSSLFGVITAFVITATTVFTSCQKDLATSQEGFSSLNDFAMTTKDVSVKKNMLVFKDQATFDKVLASLHDLSKNEEWLKANWKGEKNDNSVSLRNGSIPSYAVFDIFSSQFNFNSLLAAQIQAEEDFLDQGGEPEDFHRSFLGDDFFQALMNPSYEIMIGNLIYRFVDQDNAFVITNGDIDLIDQVRNITDPYSFQETGAIQFLNLNVQEDHLYYNQLISGALACTADFNIIPQNGGNTIIGQNTSSMMGAITSMRWEVTDANGVKFFEEQRNTDFALVLGGFTNPLPWNITLTIASSGCTQQQSLYINA